MHDIAVSAAASGVPTDVLRLDYRSDLDGAADWALMQPPRSGRDWVVCIHGHGSCADQLYTRADIRDLWLPEFRRRNYGILAPNLRGNSWMGPAAVQDLDDLLHEVRSRCDADRFLFASGSMGGTSNLIYGALRPQNVQGIIARGAASDLGSYHAWCRRRPPDRPVISAIADAIEAAYGGTPQDAPEAYDSHSPLRHAHRLSMPVFLCHGACDRTIPVSQSRRLVGAMAESVRLVYAEVADGNHDSPLYVTAPVHPLDWIGAQWQLTRA